MTGKITHVEEGGGARATYDAADAGQTSDERTAPGSEPEQAGNAQAAPGNAGAGNGRPRSGTSIGTRSG